MESLVVVQPFGEYMRGQTITDPKEIEDIISSDRLSYVVKTNIEEAE